MTTIVSVRRNGKVVMGGDGQVSLGNTVMKGNAKKVRRLYHGQVLAGFAGATADAFTLFERFEGQLEKHQGHLVRAAVELAKDWRTDRSLSRLEAMLAVANKDASLIITGNGDVVQPENDLAVLKALKTCMDQCLRERVDWVARYGGEEFVIVLPHTGLAEARGVAERLRQVVEKELGRLAGLPGGGQVTASFGVAAYVPGSDPGALLELADQRLYAAKQAGRNRVVCDFC